MPIYGFKVIYQERAYHCINIMPDFGGGTRAETGFDKPKFLEVVIINEDGELRIVRDEAWCFQFIPKVEGR